jgi:hypothetical protein
MLYGIHVAVYSKINTKQINTVWAEYTGCPKKITPFSKIFLWAPDVILEFCAHGNGGYFNQN